jgi:phage shock protein C
MPDAQRRRDRHDEPMAQHVSSNTTTTGGFNLDGFGLYRSTVNRRIKGVCGGIAERYHVDATIVRIAFVLLTLWLMSHVTGWAAFGYFVLAFVMRERPTLPAVIDADPFDPLV